MVNRIVGIIENITGYKELSNNIEIDLLENEILDSMAFIELVTLLEEEFDIEIQPTTVDPEVWRSVYKIEELVKKLKR